MIRSKNGGEKMRGIKIGICQWSFPIEGPYACRVASELGIEGIELDLGDYERNFPLSNKTIQKAYMEARNTWGIFYPSIAVNTLCNYGMSHPPDTKKGKIALAAIHKGIEAAEALNIPIVQLPSFFDGEIKSKDDFKHTIKCLKFGCEFAMEKGIIIATENALSVEDNKILIKEVGYPNFKIYFDLQNPYFFRGYKVPQMLKELTPYICEIHAKDGTREHLSGALLGKGEADFFASMEILKQLNYTGWINLENYYDRAPINPGNKDPFELIKEDISTLKKTFK